MHEHYSQCFVSVLNKNHDAKVLPTLEPELIISSVHAWNIFEKLEIIATNFLQRKTEGAFWTTDYLSD